MSAKVAKKISRVMAKVDYLQKDGKIAFGATRYSYLSEEKVTSEIRKAMNEVGLIIYPAKMEVISEKEVSTKSGASRVLNIITTYRIQDTESGEFVEAQAIGEGMDSGDKTVYKAMTGAFKYVQRQTFMIPTGDDPDKTASDELVNGKPQETQNMGLLATKKQLAALYAAAKEAGRSADDMKVLIKERFGKESSRDLTKKEASELIAELSKRTA